MRPSPLRRLVGRTPCLRLRQPTGLRAHRRCHPHLVTRPPRIRGNTAPAVGHLSATNRDEIEPEVWLPWQGATSPNTDVLDTANTSRPIGTDLTAERVLTLTRHTVHYDDGRQHTVWQVEERINITGPDRVTQADTHTHTSQHTANTNAGMQDGGTGHAARCTDTLTNMPITPTRLVDAHGNDLSNRTDSPRRMIESIHAVRDRQGLLGCNTHYPHGATNIEGADS